MSKVSWKDPKRIKEKDGPWTEISVPNDPKSNSLRRALSGKRGTFFRQSQPRPLRDGTVVLGFSHRCTHSRLEISVLHHTFFSCLLFFFATIVDHNNHDGIINSWPIGLRPKIIDSPWSETVVNVKYFGTRRFFDMENFVILSKAKMGRKSRWSQ